MQSTKFLVHRTQIQTQLLKGTKDLVDAIIYINSIES